MNKLKLLLVALTVAAVASLVIWSRSGEQTPDRAESRKAMPTYRAAGIEVGLTTVPPVPKVGENRLVVELRMPDGEPVAAGDVEAYAEMPAMGAMSAMRAPAGLEQTGAGRYEGTLDLSMRGEWPLTLTFTAPGGQPARLQFDLATDRADMPISSGGEPAGGAQAAPSDGGPIITIDNRRRQMIGVTTGLATHRDLVKSIRAVGVVAVDETRLSQVALKFDGYIGELEADYVGMPVEKGQVLFTMYSPELLAAQDEYLEVRRRRANGAAGDGLQRAARQRLRLWDMSDAQIAALEDRGTALEYVPVHAPRSGTLIERHIADGSAAQKMRPLLTIADLSRVWVEAEVFEGDLEFVRDGMMAEVRLPYLSGRRYPARIDYVYPTLDARTRTGRIRLSLDNSAGEFKPDMYAEVTLQAELGHRLSVPEQAIIVAGRSRVVFVDLGGGRLQPRRIRTGRQAGDFVEVLEGLSLNDEVVTSGNFLIAAETRLKAGIDQW